MNKTKKLLTEIDKNNKEIKADNELIENKRKVLEDNLVFLKEDIKILEARNQGIINQINSLELFQVTIKDLKEEITRLEKSKIENTSVEYFLPRLEVSCYKLRKNLDITLEEFLKLDESMFKLGKGNFSIIRFKNEKKITKFKFDIYRKFNVLDKLSDGSFLKDHLFLENYVDSTGQKLIRVALNNSCVDNIILSFTYQELINLKFFGMYNSRGLNYFKEDKREKHAFLVKEAIINCVTRENKKIINNKNN